MPVKILYIYATYKIPSMRPILITILALLTLAGCDASSGIGGLTPSSADMVRARDLFVRVQQRDAGAVAELEQRAGKANVAAAFYAGLANDPAVIKGGDAARAAGFYQSASRSSAGAKHNLALLILKGVVRSEQDAGLAVNLLTEAAQKDRLESMLMLASLYENGWPGVERNPALAAEWYERAMNFSNDPRAVARLGAAYQEGSGRPRDLVQAETFLEAAAKAGVAEAQFRMARTVREPLQVAQWLTIAAMTDARYQQPAREALNALSAQDQMRVKTNAELWLHAHDRRQDLVSYTSPVMEP